VAASIEEVAALPTKTQKIVEGNASTIAELARSAQFGLAGRRRHRAFR